MAEDVDISNHVAVELDSVCIDQNLTVTNSEETKESVEPKRSEGSSIDSGAKMASDVSIASGGEGNADGNENEESNNAESSLADSASESGNPPDHADSSKEEACDVDNMGWMPFVPRELWEKCFDYLSPHDLTAVSKTCVLFSNIANHPYFWRNVDFGG